MGVLEAAIRRLTGEGIASGGFIRKVRSTAGAHLGELKARRAHLREVEEVMTGRLHEIERQNRRLMNELQRRDIRVETAALEDIRGSATTPITVNKTVQEGLPEIHIEGLNLPSTAAPKTTAAVTPRCLPAI